MTAELLRKAAALMRRRARLDTAQQPWKAAPHAARKDCATIQSADSFIALYVQPQCAKHIASWHPLVALAVADWLDHEADLCESSSWYPDTGESLAVARVYLRRDA